MSSVPMPFNRDVEPFPLSFINYIPSRESMNWRLRTKNFATPILNPFFNSTRSNSQTPDDTANNYYQLTLSDSRAANSKCAQVFIELMDSAYDEFQLVPYKDSDSYPLYQYFDPVNSMVINTSTKTKCRKRNVIEVIIRSRFINNFNIFIKDPNLPEVHRSLQKKLSFSYSCTRDHNLSARIHNYLDILRAVISSVNQTPRNVISFMNVLVAKSLTVDKSFDIPITILNRVNYCKIYYLKYFYTNYIILVNNNVMQFLDNIPDSITCAICLEDDVVGVMLKPCNHSNICNNCMDSLLNWLCPICRTPVVSTTIFIY